MRYHEAMPKRSGGAGVTRMAGLVVASLLVAGCSSGGSGGGGRAAGGSGTTVAPGGQAAVTDDEALDRVLAGLDGVMGDLQRILVKDRRIGPDVTDRLQAIYTGPELLNQIDAFKADVSAGLAGYRSPPGNRLSLVSRVITASRDCVFAQVKRDYSPASSGPPTPLATLYVVLVAKNPADDPKAYNPTGWAMLYDGVQSDGSRPEDVCRS